MAFKIPLGEMMVKIKADASQFTKTMDKVAKRVETAARRMQMAGAKMSFAVTAPLAGIGLAATKQFSDFDDAMTSSLAIMGNLSRGTRREMESVARSIGREGTQSATELAEAYFFLASAGLDAEKSMKALSVVQTFASAGQFDLALATDLLTDAQSALGMTHKNAIDNQNEMIRLGNTLVKANTVANASVEQFSKALTNKAAASLRALKKPLSEGVAALAVFADQGIKGEAAGEKLSIVLRDLQTASQKQALAWKAFGLKVFDSTGKMRNLADIVSDLTATFGPMSDEQKKATATALGFADRSFGAIKTLLGTSSKMRRFQSDLTDMGDVMADVAEKQLKSFANQMKILINNIKDVGIEIGRILAPAVSTLAKLIKHGTDMWRGLNDQTKKWITWLGTVAAAIGPLLIAFGSLGLIIPTLGAGLVLFGKMALAAGALVVVLVGAGTAVTALDDLLKKFFNSSSKSIIDAIAEYRVFGVRIGTWMKLAWEKAQKGFEFLKTRVKQGLDFLKTELTIFAERFGEILRKTLADGILAGIRDGFRNIAGHMRAKKAAAAGTFADKFDFLGPQFIKFADFMAKSHDVSAPTRSPVEKFLKDKERADSRLGSLARRTLLEEQRLKDEEGRTKIDVTTAFKLPDFFGGLDPKMIAKNMVKGAGSLVAKAAKAAQLAKDEEGKDKFAGVNESAMKKLLKDSADGSSLSGGAKFEQLSQRRFSLEALATGTTSDQAQAKARDEERNKILKDMRAQNKKKQGLN